ncbi:acetyl-CoA synthetase-like protein [Trametes maxima]|nr:acetyl-CoA synthetase-like protein [Trametes maxima]
MPDFHSPEPSPLSRLLAATALAAAKSYSYRWSSSGEDATIVIQVVDARAEPKALIHSYELPVPPSLTVADLLDAARVAIPVPQSVLENSLPTVFLFKSASEIDVYFSASSAHVPAHSVLVALGDDDEFSVLSSVPSPHAHDEFLPGRVSTALTTISSHTSYHHHLRIVDVIPEAERGALFSLCENNPPSEVTHPCIHHYFEETARASPHLPALAFDNPNGTLTTLTYGDMDAQCTVLAAYLISTHAIGPGVIVPLFFSRGIEMLIAIFAVLKAGASYVPLDPDHPAERTAVIVGAVEGKLVLTESKFLEEVRSRVGETSTVVDMESLQSLEVPAEDVSGRGSADDLAYVLFTSGTTGVPKGVMVHHTAVVKTSIDGPPLNRALRKKEGLRTFMFSNYAFDASIWDMFITLSSGGCLCLATKEATMDDLAGVISRLSANFVMTTPTVLALLEPADVPALDVVYSCGEMLTPAVRDRFTQAGRTLGNVYGPTETTVSCTFDVVEDGTKDPTIIGKPFGWSRAYILDEGLKMVPHGAVGTLWIAGPQLSKGYLARPELTEASYRPDPFARGDQVGQRMYNTGDLCAWVQDGYLKCFGRADEQMKIRGQRVEVLEIEAVISRVPDVFATCVVKRVQDGREDLVAFYCVEASSTSDPASVEKEIAETVSRHLPTYMRPSTFVHLDKLPVTVNGKADRRRLRQQAADLKPVLALVDDTPKEPRSDTEELVAQCWSAILGIPADAVPLTREFYECGGDSVSIIRLAAALREKGLQLKTSDLRAATTVAAQAALALNRKADEVTDAVEIYQPFSLISNTGLSTELIAGLVDTTSDAIEDVYPCSSTVSGLVSLAATNPQSYFAQHAFRRSGSYDVAHLLAAWKTVVARHPILRTAFVIPPHPATEILQVVFKSEHFTLQWTRQQHINDTDLDRALAAYLETSRQSGFHLGIVPTRVGLFESPTSSVMVLQIHHSQYDGWSLPVILNDLQEAYESLQATGAPRITSPYLPYSDFVRWARQQSSSDALSFWKYELEDAALLAWPKVPHDTNDIATDTLVSASWAPPDGVDLARFCSEHKITASSLLRVALGVVLGIHGNTDDVLFGVVTSGRSGDLGGIENVVGPCIATLPFRVHVPPSASLQSILDVVQERSSASSAFEYVGLADITKASTLSGSRNIFQVLLTVENIPELDLHAHPVFGADIHGHQMEMNYPLGVTVFLLPQNRGFNIDIEYDSHYLSAADVRWFQSHLLATLDAIVRSPTTTIEDIDIISDEEHTFLKQVGIGLTPDPSLASEPLVHRLIEKTAQAYPHRVAVEHTSGHTLTYAELDALANRTARGLRARGVSLETPIPVLFNKDADQSEAVVAIVATMKSGAAFVPLDVSWPSARIQSCVRQCNAPFVVCDAIVPDVARDLPVPFVTVTDLSEGQEEEQYIHEEQTPHSLAYVIFTSGSTGEPKGVMIEHRNIMGYVANGTTVYPINDVKRLLHFSPFSFDQGLGDIFMALTKGATLVLANISDVLTDLSDVLNLTRVDYTVLTPAIAQLIRNDVEHPHLKSLLVGGEKLPGQLVDRWKGKVAFMDDYGPTEVTVSCVGMTFTETTQASAGVIGSPYGDTRAYIVDPARPSRPLPVGAVGELCLSGNQVGRGYLNRPDLTAAAFVPDPFASGLTMYRSGDRARWTSDGFIEYLGRQDDAFIKLRGLRIDVGEVEDALAGAGDTFAVVELLDLRGAPHLVAFLSRTLAPTGEARLALSFDPASDAEGAAHLREWLAGCVQACRQAVPAYAVPTVWLALDAMPQNANSKFDRKQLRAFFRALEPGTVETCSAALTQTHAPRAPETSLERAVARVWCNVLGRGDDLTALSVYDDFFALGGDSIAVVRMLAGLKTLGMVISLKEFAAGPTIAEVAEYFGSSAGSASPETSDDGLPSLGNGLVWQVQSGEAGVPLWLIHDGAGLGNEYKNMASLGRHVQAISNPTSTLSELRAQFPSFDSYVSAYAPLIPADDDVCLGGWSFGGAVALTIAARRIASGQRVRAVILIDSFNTTGWRPANSDAPLAEAGEHERLSADAFAAAHQAHMDKIVGEFREASVSLSVPVLLVRAGIGMGVKDIEKAGFNVPYDFLSPDAKRSVDSGIAGIDVESDRLEETDEDRRSSTQLEALNFWNKSALPELEVVNIEGADHYSLMREGTLCARASEEIAKWLRGLGV